MRVLVTGSSGHLGEALIRTLRTQGYDAIGMDVVSSPFTTRVGSIVDRSCVRDCMQDVAVVLHTATLHKPHVMTHSRQDFVDTNITGTLNLLEEAILAGVGSFIFTSTTSAFGHALTPLTGQPAAWITEDTLPIPRNIYGVTKLAAENLCELFHKQQGLPCLVLRTSRFFPEEDDDGERRRAYVNENVKANEYLHRRVDLEDVVTAHLLAMEHAPTIGFGRYIISATTPFVPDDLSELRRDAPAVVKRCCPEYQEVYTRLGWKMFPSIERVYVNDRSRNELGWLPQYDFHRVIASLKAGKDFRSELSKLVGSKGYHATVFSDGPYPVE